MTLQQLKATVPQIGWTTYLSTLQGRNVNDTEQVVIYAVDYMKQLVALLAVTEPRTVANYMMWRFVRHTYFAGYPITFFCSRQFKMFSTVSAVGWLLQ